MIYPFKLDLASLMKVEYTLVKYKKLWQDTLILRITVMFDI
jgi:hypothetical protein